METISQHISLLLFKRLNGELTGQEEEELNDWLSKPERTDNFRIEMQDEEAIIQLLIQQKRDLQTGVKQQLFSRIQRLINGQTIDSARAANDLYSIPSPAGTTRHTHFLTANWFKYAASVILVLGAATYFWITTKKTEQPFVKGNPYLQTNIAPGRDRAILTLANGQQILLDSTQGNIVKQGSLIVINLAGKVKYEGAGAGEEYNTISTPKGGQYQIVLPDGSKVWLNAASSVRFPTAFTGPVRKVEMTGEAYMEVAKNSKQSFIVSTNGMEIQVLGTSFNVNAYEDEETLKTTLIEGSIKVSKRNSSGSSPSIILKPREQAIINHSENAKIQKMVIQSAGIDQALAWKNGAFRFNHTDLSEIMRQLARWYDVEILYEKGIPDIQLDGDMERNLSLSQMLDFLSELGVKLRIEGRRIIVLK